MEQGHLGGYLIGGDPATYYPDLWRWLVEVEEVKSVLDVGCGEGHALNFFRDLDCAVLGVDGIAQGDPDIDAHDYTVGPFTDYVREYGSLVTYDLCWSCEFVEHIEERYLPNFLATFACADMVLMTHAEPGQLGYHHVNCRTADYWKGALAAVGFGFDEALTLATRALASANEDPHNHFVRSGIAFRRYS